MMASDDEPASSQLSLNPLLTSLLLGTRASNALPHGAAFEYQTSFAAWARETCALSAHAAALLARLSRHLTAEAPAPLAGAENDEEAHAAFSHYSELVETLLEDCDYRLSHGRDDASPRAAPSSSSPRAAAAGARDALAARGAAKPQARFARAPDNARAAPFAPAPWDGRRAAEVTLGDGRSHFAHPFEAEIARLEYAPWMLRPEGTDAAASAAPPPAVDAAAMAADGAGGERAGWTWVCLLYTSPSPRD